ncbi:VC2046/SO_2500 family protein [Aeromonas tecta]|uniref:VC2046/SO_2500 family protein n=1 Tax=Aeromonas tecta TaxID=324617 RepID=UPI0006811D0B|nr:VC2046/SO_2500 family protein [Aeromonas tecta]
MLPSTIRDRLLVDEAQLGQRLNQDLCQGDRADFRLHLALLTDAVEEQPWFGASPAAEPQAKVWRAHFGLPPQASLQGELDESGNCAINERLQQGGSMVDVRLWLALRSPPLVSKTPALDPAVYDNLSALGRERWQGKLAAQPREELPLLMLPLLDELKLGVDARLRWLS